MKVYYDRAVEAAYIQVSERQPDGVIGMADGVNLDITNNDEIVGIEILNASHKLPLKSLFVYELDEAVWPAGAA